MWDKIYIHSDLVDNMGKEPFRQYTFDFYIRHVGGIIRLEDGTPVYVNGTYGMDIMLCPVQLEGEFENIDSDRSFYRGYDPNILID